MSANCSITGQKLPVCLSVC